jgi:hypothetical protein
MADIAVFPLDTPDVEGELVENAQTILDGAGIDESFVSIQLAASITVPAGYVISQSIPAGTANFDDDDVMVLTVSDGAAVVEETLIDEHGAIRASLTGITVLIWRTDAPTGAPDVELTGQVTDVDGLLYLLFVPGELEEDDPVFYMAYQGTPASSFTAGLVVPTLY